MKSSIFISIVIPHFNKTESIEKLIQSVRDSQCRDFNIIEVIIVDDGSSPGAVSEISKLISKLPCKGQLFKLNKNSGPAKARNYGVSKSRGKYIIFLDADVVLQKKSLQKAVDFFRLKKGKAFTGIWSYKQKTSAFFPQFKALRDHSYWFIEREKNARYYLFSTRIAGIEKKLFQSIGQFNLAFKKPTVEDIELTYRIEQKAKIHFEPEIVVLHEFENFLPIAKKYFLRSRDWIKLYIKRLRFDPVATSKKEAKKSVYSGLSVIFFIFFLATGEIFFLLPALMCLIIFLIFEKNFLLFLLKKKGVIFMLKSILVSYLLYAIINAGATIGGLEYYLLKKQ